MKTLYGIEPDFCISNPEIVAGYGKDIVLPKYFYTQLDYLKNGRFESATNAAAKLIDSLLGQGESDLLIFKNLSNGTVYFVNQQINIEDIHARYNNFEIGNPLDRYLLSLLKVAEIIEAKIVFIAAEAQIIRKCYALGFEVAGIEEFSSPGESWLQPEMIVDIQAKLDPLALVLWQDDSEEVVEPENGIRWLDMTS